MCGVVLNIILSLMDLRTWVCNFTNTNNCVLVYVDSEINYANAGACYRSACRKIKRMETRCDACACTIVFQLRVRCFSYTEEKERRTIR